MKFFGQITVIQFVEYNYSFRKTGNLLIFCSEKRVKLQNIRSEKWEICCFFVQKSVFLCALNNVRYVATQN